MSTIESNELRISRKERALGNAQANLAAQVAVARRYKILLVLVAMLTAGVVGFSPAIPGVIMLVIAGLLTAIVVASFDVIDEPVVQARMRVKAIQAIRSVK